MSLRRLRNFPILQSRYTEYKKWEDMTPAQRQAAYATVAPSNQRARYNREQGFVSVFNSANATRVFLTGQILAASQSGTGAALGTIVRGIASDYTETQAEFGALAGNPIALPGRKYPFARISLTTVVPSTSETATNVSRITGARYRKPSVDTCTSIFGQKTGAQTYNEAVAEIRGIAAFITHMNGNNGKNRSRFTPEG